jgi:hypothetical protein
VDSEVGADARASVQDLLGLVPDVVDDPPADLDATVANQNASAFLVDRNPPIRTGTVSSIATNFLVPGPTTMSISTRLSASGRSGLDLSAGADASSFGEVLFEVPASAGAEGGAAVFLTLAFALAGLDPALGTASASYMIENVTLGGILFNSDLSGFPDQTIVTGARAGDLLRLTYAANLSVIFPDGQTSHALDLTSSLQALADIPEPSSLLLVVLGLTGLAWHRRRSRAIFFIPVLLMVVSTSPTAWAGDGHLFAGLIPGQELSDCQLGQVYGRGLNLTSSTSVSSEAEETTGEFFFEFFEEFFFEGASQFATSEHEELELGQAFGGISAPRNGSTSGRFERIEPIKLERIEPLGFDSGGSGSVTLSTSSGG